jgi:hypothetical protein
MQWGISHNKNKKVTCNLKILTSDITKKNTIAKKFINFQIIIWFYVIIIFFPQTEFFDNKFTLDIDN